MRLAPYRSLAAAIAAHDADPFSRSGSALAGYSFQFDTAAALGDAPEASDPRFDAGWTLGRTLAEIRRRDARLVLGSRGIRLTHAHRMAELAGAVAGHEGPLTVWLRLGLDADRAPSPWDDETRLYAAWFDQLFRAPAAPVALRPGVSIVDVPAFRASVAGRLAAGPGGAGADALRADLASLYTQYGADAERLVVPAPAYARAA